MVISRKLLFVGLVLMSGSILGQTGKPSNKTKSKHPTSTSTKKKTTTIKSTVTLTPASSDNSLLWQISGRGLKTPSYIYGTMHILCDSDATLSPALKKVIHDCSQIFFEVDMDDMQSMMGAIQYARMNEGIKISDLLTPIEYERVKKYFTDHKSPIPFAMMNRFKPYFVSAMISEGILDCPVKSSVEQKIMSENSDSGKEILGLESLEFQASLFDSIPYEKQAKDLLSYIDSIDSYRQTSMQMEALYKKQQVANLDTLLQKSDPGMTQYMDLLLYDRNARWAMQIPEQIFEKKTLFAVGAGHLGGEKGVISLLKKQGFTLTPLKN